MQPGDHVYAAGEAPLEADTPPPEVGLFAGRVVHEKYRLLSHLGGGGMGTVFSAEHIALGRRYALKFLRSESIANERAMRRFQREALLLAKLDHENIVGLVDVGMGERGPWFLVLELIRGLTLRQEFKRAQIAADRMVAITVQVARGLVSAHAAGVVHRDLKPENIMLTEHADGRLLVKLLDFGVARLCDNAPNALTITGQTPGTAAYMSPEQARGDASLDARSDVYSLGVIVYEGLAGRRPHESSSYNETLFKVLNQPSVSLAVHRPDLPVRLTAAVDKCLAKHPGDRFNSPWELAAEMRDAMADRAKSVGDSIPLDLQTSEEWQHTREATVDSSATLLRAGSSGNEAASPAPVHDEAANPEFDGQRITAQRGNSWFWLTATGTLALGLGVFGMWAFMASPAPVPAGAKVPPRESPANFASTAEPTLDRPSELARQLEGTLEAPATTALRAARAAVASTTKAPQPQSRAAPRTRSSRAATAPAASGVADLGGDFEASPYAR